MANFSALKTAIQNAIKQNGNEEITGDVLQQILLSIVSTMGDVAINTIEQNLSNETTNRQGADTQLQNAINAIKANIDNGYVYAGIATPSTTPVSGKVFYIAMAAGTYTNFGGQVLTQGINILRYNGSAWSHQQLIGIDDVPTAGSNRLVKSGGVQNELALGAVYDVSAKNPTGGPNSDGKWESLAALLSDANLNTLIPTTYRKGGMSIKFVQSSDNKYVQFRYMISSTANADFINVANWQGVDDVPVAESKNFVESGGVKGFLYNEDIDTFKVNGESQPHRRVLKTIKIDSDISLLYQFHRKTESNIQYIISLSTFDDSHYSNIIADWTNTDSEGIVNTGDYITSDVQYPCNLKISFRKSDNSLISTSDVDSAFSFLVSINNHESAYLAVEQFRQNQEYKNLNAATNSVLNKHILYTDKRIGNGASINNDNPLKPSILESGNILFNEDSFVFNNLYDRTRIAEANGIYLNNGNIIYNMFHQRIYVGGYSFSGQTYTSGWIQPKSNYTIPKDGIYWILIDTSYDEGKANVICNSIIIDTSYSSICNLNNSFHYKEKIKYIFDYQFGSYKRSWYPIIINNNEELKSFKMIINPKSSTISYSIQIVGNMYDVSNLAYYDSSWLGNKLSYIDYDMIKDVVSYPCVVRIMAKNGSNTYVPLEDYKAGIDFYTFIGNNVLSNVFSASDIYVNIINKYLNLCSENNAIPYYGKKISLKEDVALSCYDEMLHSETVGSAALMYDNNSIDIFDGKLFCFLDTYRGRNDIFCRIYNMTNYSVIADINTPIETCHFNMVCFTDIYYDSNDSYPLLFASSGNENSTNYIYIIRLIESGGAITATVVKTITVNLPYSTYSGSATLDKTNNVVYFFCVSNHWRVGADYTIIYSFKLPDITSGADVIITESDILCPPIYLPWCDNNEAIVYRGNIYMNSKIRNGHPQPGYNIPGNHICLMVINPLTGRVESIVDDNAIGMESEGITIHNNEMYISYRQSGTESTDIVFKLYKKIFKDT